MKVYKNIKFTGTRVHPEAGFPCKCFEDENGVDWYIERKTWKGAVIAVWVDEEPYVASWSKNAMDHIPCEGQTLFEVDASKIPVKTETELLGNYIFDGENFSVRKYNVKQRTKEDILADLEKLKAELLSL